MTHQPGEPTNPEQAPATVTGLRPALRLVSSRDEDHAFEAPDEGLRRLLRAPARPSSWVEDDDPGPSAA